MIWFYIFLVLAAAWYALAIAIIRTNNFHRVNRLWVAAITVNILRLIEAVLWGVFG